jgi:glutathione S-transferase
MKVKYKLYQFPLCPFSRKVRLFLLEKNINVDIATENFWEKREKFIAINPTGKIPVLLSYEQQTAICDSTIICEFLEESYGGIKFLGDTPLCKAEIKRINNWFDEKFYQEVTQYIVSEKVIKYYQGKGSPNPVFLRAAKINIKYHFDYMAYLLNSRKWLAGNKISLADISAASHISVLDYLGHINWQKHNVVKEWYMLIKSRPSFTNILQDNIFGFKAASHYKHLDF